jgi:hypothetical protein
MDLLKRRSERRREASTRPPGRGSTDDGTASPPVPPAAPERPIDEPPGHAPARGVTSPIDRSASGPDRDGDGVDDRDERPAATSVFEGPVDDPAHRRTEPTPVASHDTSEHRHDDHGDRHDDRDDRDQALASAYEEGRAAERREHSDEVVEDVVVTRWSIADLVVTLVGVGLIVAGALALARAGVDDTWYSPVAEVVGANHTALLGAAEVGAGVLIVLAGVARRRVLATLFGLALAILAGLAAIETADVSRELAIEDWWAWLLVAAGALVVLMGLIPRKARIRRVAHADDG